MNRSIVVTVVMLLTLGLAQAPGGQILGVVRDRDGGVIPGTTVTAALDSEQRKTFTNSAGRYRLADLPPGRYRLEASLAGFRTAVAEGVILGPTGSVEHDFVLDILTGPDPIEDLRQSVRPFTGSEPLECGRHALVQENRQWLAADEQALRRSVECGLTAASAKRTFWTFKQDQGIDSWIASGLLGTGDGTIHRFMYDSAPCGGPGCSSRIRFERCDKPLAATKSDGRSEFRCGK